MEASSRLHAVSATIAANSEYSIAERGVLNMSKKNSLFNHNQIVEWLKKRCPSDEKAYTTFEDIPPLREKLLAGKLPIDLGYSVDLIYVKEVEEEKDKEPGKKENVLYYTLFLVSTNEISDESGKILDSFSKRLLFYQFYFSSIAEPKTLKIIFVVPHDVDIPSKTIAEFFNEYKFGLWKVDIDKTEEEEVVAAKYLRDRMSEEFGESADNTEDVGKTIKEISERIEKDEPILRKAIKGKAEDFAIFFEQYILEAVNAISEIKPEQIGKRYIDRKLIDFVFNLKNVSYGNELCDLVNKHLTQKGDDYLFTRECFETLWRSKFDGMIYPKTLEQFESFLQHFFPAYREHFTHQFQVFLLGTIILDCLFQNPTNVLEEGKNKKDDIAKGWLLTSSIHDFTYPLQKYDEWSSGFFKEQLRIDEPLSFLELKGIYVEKTFLTRVEHLLSEIEKDFIEASGYEKTILYNEIRRFFYYEIAEKKNHGLMGGSYLLKRFEGKEREEFSNVVLPAAAAIATHDDEIWQTLSGQVNGDINKEWEYIAKLIKIEKSEDIIKILKDTELANEKKDREIATILRKNKEWIGNIYADISNIIMKKPLSKLYLKSQPLTFLLILCDNLQDCGRPCKDEELNKGMEAADIRLKDIVNNHSTITIQLFFNEIAESRKFMTYKAEMLRKVEKLIGSSDIEFIIEFWERGTNAKKDTFRIGR